MDEETRKEEIQLHREKVASGKRPAMWHELTGFMRLQVALVQSMKHHGLVLNTTTTSSGNEIEVRRSSFPCAVVVCRFEERFIDCRFTYKRSDEADTIEWRERIGFAVDHLDNVQFTHKGNLLIDTAEAGRVVLVPVLDPHFAPPQAETH